jgi:hypothetical protein
MAAWQNDYLQVGFNASLLEGAVLNGLCFI